LPYSAKRRETYPLHQLLSAWLVDGVENGKDELRKAIVISDEREALVEKLDKAFSSLIDAQMAIVNLKSLEHDLVLTLFNRIGSGGTPLTGEEMLFSIYKFHEPKISDTVNALYNDPTVGRALPPTKIAAAAIRIANALAHIEKPEEGNWLPSVDAFRKEMSEKGSKIGQQLDELLGSEGETIDAEDAKFTAAFRWLFRTFAWRVVPSERGLSDIGLPKVMMVTLSPRLVEVLLLWVIAESEINAVKIESERADIIRFVMFWRLCVVNEDKASNLCFVRIKTEKRFVPVAELFDAISFAPDGIAIPLVDPEKMKELLCSDEPSNLWLTYNERFTLEPNPQSAIARVWWTSGKSTLIWLQRAYLQGRFPDFDPASGRDDDTPYDVDHMVPHSDWGRNWMTFDTIDMLPGVSERGRIRQSRFVFGDSIGNCRLIDYSVNRAEQDDTFMRKIEKEIMADAGRPIAEMSCEEIEYHSSMGFDPGAINLWKIASGGDDNTKPNRRIWRDERLIAFQRAVEERAAWLYDKFYSELGFASWEGRVDNTIPLVQ
jgi:hypothetical protein